MLTVMLVVLPAGWAQGEAELAAIRARAAQGDSEALNALGNAYTNGLLGAPPDQAEALKWFRLAADQGFPPALFNLGLAFELGRGTAVDERQALKFYLKAAEQGYAPAQFNVGNLYAAGRGVGQDFFEANLWYKQAADSGLVEAQFNLGLAYEAGRGVKKDEVLAARWYRQAADRGYARAQYNLGLLLEDGRGVAKDTVAATALYRAAAEQGFAPAQINYGLALAEGDHGGARDPVQAYVWLSRAVQNGASPTARDALAKAMTGEQLAAANQLLGGGPAPAPAAVQPATVAADNPSARLIDQLRDQSRRLSARVEELSTEKEATERQTEILRAQVRDLQQEKSVLAAAAAKTVAEPARAAVTEAPPPSSIVANLQRDNARLNDEVKRATRELLALNQQLRALRSQPPPPAASATDDGASAQAAQLAEARLAGERLQQQLATVQREKAELEKWTATLEKNLNEKSAATGRQLQERDEALARQSALAAKLAAENRELQERLARIEAQKGAATGPGGDLAALEELRQQLTRAQARTEELDGQNRILGIKHAAELQASQEARQAIATLQKDLRTAQSAQLLGEETIGRLRAELARAGGGAAGGGGLQQQLNEANQALEKSATSVAELTAANDRLEQDLAAARRGSAENASLRDLLGKARLELADLATLRDDNVRLRQEAAAALQAKGEQADRERTQQTAALNSSREDLAQARARVAELEKQLAAAPVVRTRPADTGAGLQADLDEANRSVEKLTVAVAELTAANEKLEQDLASAQKSTAAALAAQSQAVSAASPDAYQMEIRTLNSQIKQLEGQVEEERASTAREVSTLAAQMQRLRETNKSLTDANRALLSAKDNDTAATRDDLEQLQGRVRELTAANEEMRRAGQKHAADLRALAAERDSLQSQLVDARKVATVLPGLADEKAALQERLEAVGGQLVQLQRENEGWEQAKAELTRQVAASRQSAERAQAELAALQGRAAEAERAVESHTASVAELTQVNARLEQQHEDMRRLVESYRTDIARLTQAVRAAEQQKAEAERSGQQNIDAVSAQLGQARREVEAARTAQARLTENFATQDRERAAIIAQLRTENSALAGRLNQAQSTLDQIASAARLGTPASAIAAGGPVPVRPAVPVVSTAAETRYHTVVEGDSLSRISLRYYGTANRWQEIFQANRDVLQGSSALRVGMQLRIP